jgi:hypothetical protein
LPFDRHFPGTINLHGEPTSAEIQALVDDRSVKVVRPDRNVSSSTWARLDVELFQRRPDVRLAISALDYDLSSVCGLKYLRNLAFSCLGKATGLEDIVKIPALESLYLHVYRLDSFEFLREISPLHLTSLTLGRTKSAKPSLAPLARFANLKKVYLEGHRKEIEVIGTLRRLEDLTIRSVTTPDLSYLRSLPRLLSVDLKLGGTKNLAALAGMKTIRYLEVWQVSGLTNVEVAGQLPGLQYLFLQALPHVKRLPSFVGSRALRRVHLFNMPGLKDLRPLESAPALEDLVFYDARQLIPEAFESLLAKRSLKHATVGFGSKAKNERFDELAESHGIRRVERPYKFRA